MEKQKKLLRTGLTSKTLQYLALLGTKSKEFKKMNKTI
jgi:hypothetical protein